MALIERLMGLQEPKIPVHAFQSVMGEWARGKINGVQSQAIVTYLSGQGLDAAEVAEATAIVATVTDIPITGSAAAIADGRARRAMRVKEIDQVLLLAETLAPGYSTGAEVRTKLGV